MLTIGGRWRTWKFSISRATALLSAAAAAAAAAVTVVVCVLLYECVHRKVGAVWLLAQG